MKMFFKVQKAGNLSSTKLKSGDIIAYIKEKQCVIFYRPDSKYGGYAEPLYIVDDSGRKDHETYLELMAPGALMHLAEIISACTGFGCQLLTKKDFPNVDMAFKFI